MKKIRRKGKSSKSRGKEEQKKEGQKERRKQWYSANKIKQQEEAVYSK